MGPVNDIGTLHGLQKAQNPFKMKVAVSSESNLWGVDLQNLESFAITVAICVIEASSGHGMIQMFFKESKCLIWVTTYKVPSEFPQDYAVIFEILSLVLNFGRFWHATFLTNFTRSFGRNVLPLKEVCLWYLDSSWIIEGPRPIKMNMVIYCKSNLSGLDF